MNPADLDQALNDEAQELDAERSRHHGPDTPAADANSYLWGMYAGLMRARDIAAHIAAGQPVIPDWPLDLSGLDA